MFEWRVHCSPGIYSMLGMRCTFQTGAFFCLSWFPRGNKRVEGEGRRGVEEVPGQQQTRPSQMSLLLILALLIQIVYCTSSLRSIVEDICFKFQGRHFFLSTFEGKLWPLLTPQPCCSRSVIPVGRKVDRQGQVNSISVSVYSPIHFLSMSVLQHMSCSFCC